MKPASVSIQFEKKVSDGNYGHESVSVYVTAELNAGEDITDAGEWLTKRARDVATRVLHASPSLAVRRSLDRQEPRQAREDEL